MKKIDKLCIQKDYHFYLNQMITGRRKFLASQRKFNRYICVSSIGDDQHILKYYLKWTSMRKKYMLNYENKSMN